MLNTDKKRKLKWSDVWREARDLIWRHRRRLALGMSLMLVSRAAGWVLPASSKFVVDTILGHADPGGIPDDPAVWAERIKMLWLVAGAVGAATVVEAITSFANSQIIGVAAQKAITDMRRRVQRHVSRLPVRFFDSTQTGILISRIMTDAEGIRNLVGTGLLQLVGGVITGIIALCVLLWLNWKLTTLTILALAAYGVFMAVVFRRLRPIFRARGQINAEVTGRLSESLGGIRIVKAYTAERREQLVFTHGAHRLLRNVAKSMTGVSATTAISTVVVGVIGVIVIIVGGNSILTGAMTIGDFILYIASTFMLAAPVVQIAAVGTQISDAFAGLDRIHEVLSMRAEDEDEDQKLPVESIRGDVVFEDVSFEYLPGVPVLKGVSFHAPAGSTTALVGSSGSGKSTMISLVMAFNRPTCGRVLVDGNDLNVIRLRDYRDHLGIVMQDNFLFDGTIADNIRFSAPNASIEEAIRVSKIAHSHEFVDGFENKYETIVGERGVRLSGGQRQRIAIARAILADPSILILDEATSSLDSESEALIQDGLRALRQGRTTFVIAHRLSTIRSADQILVMEGGEIVERGTHTELLELNGRYRQLYDKQYRLETDQFINPGEDFTPDLPKAEIEPPA
ncbi:MAG: ABC transporter ATP-binding protein [Candidatus Hydrogenedentes bacterium]|nr:ABC transporter ATP-binding protein [Candidatus Hydrogenedentota bacterium]